MCVCVYRTREEKKNTEQSGFKHPVSSPRHLWRLYFKGGLKQQILEARETTFTVVELITDAMWNAFCTKVCVCSPKGQQAHNRTRIIVREWKKAARLPGLCADGAAFLAQGSRAPTLDLIFFMWAAQCSVLQSGLLPLCQPPSGGKDMHDFIHERYM